MTVEITSYDGEMFVSLGGPMGAKGVLLSCHGIWNFRYVNWKILISSDFP